MHGLHGLALAVADEADQVPTRGIALDLSPETVGELVGTLSEALQQRSDLGFVHERYRMEFASFVQVRNIG
jgi:hypothetical protein